jgi:O-methyltransferase
MIAGRGDELVIMDAASYVRQLHLLSDQIDKNELRIILSELMRTLASVEGDVVEFGCYVGTTSVHLAHFLAPTAKQLFLYDSFAGLPPKTSQDVSPAGEQFKEGELLATKKQLITNLKKANVPMPIIRKGWFSDLQPADVPERISFAFLDGDYYDSVRDPLRLIWAKLTPGAVVVVDDYANEALPGAAKAVDEWLRTHPARLRVESSLAILYIP